jgi:osmotically-inducible protein OsmY
MKHSILKVLSIGLLFSTSITFTSCKGKSKDASSETTTTPTTETAPPPAPVEISADDQLRTGVKDATKDFPGVTATVNNGEITLTGDLERSRLQTLMQSLNSLGAKKVNNQLKLK